MADVTANFVGAIPEYYDHNLGPRLFFDYANDSKLGSSMPLQTVIIQTS